MQSRNLKKFFNTTITIERLSKTSDNFGGYTSVWEKKYWNVKARIYGGMGKSYTVTIEGSHYEVAYKIITDKSVDLVLGDKITDENEGDKYILGKLAKVVGCRETNHIEGGLALLDE